MNTLELKKLVNDYKERFGEPFPVWGYEDDEIASLVQEALEKGEPVKEGAESEAPKGALL